MPYSNIPGVKGSYIDGNLLRPTGTTQPRILVIGPSASGESDEIFAVAGTAAAEQEFGASSPVMRGVHEALAQGANNLAILRSGGRQGSWVFTDSAGATLTITPEIRDDAVLSRYALVLQAATSGSGNRILVFDLTDSAWVYDNEEILVINNGIVDVVDTGIDTFTVNDITSPTTATTLAAVVIGDFTATGTATATSAVGTAGADGTDPTYVERYAALERSYHRLDYRDADIVLPVDVYADTANIVDETAADFTNFGYYWLGLPGTAQDDVNNKLGYYWRYLYRGKMYSYFVDSDTYFTDLGTAAAASTTVQTDITLTAQKDGKGGNAVSFQVTSITGGATEVVTIARESQRLTITVSDDGAGTTATLVTAINTALQNFTLPNGTTADSLVVAAGGSGAALAVDGAAVFLSGGLGGAVLTHSDLTGDSVPAAVTAKFAAGADAELREVNFAHQLASALEVASANWKAMVGAVTVVPPQRFSRGGVADWVGSLPTYTNDGVDTYIDAPTDNGDGLLGFKFLAGESKTGEGYRSSLVDNGDTTDGIAYGGFIKTVGAALPNGTEWPYGVNDADEASDDNGAPVDLGKHIFICYDYPIHSNSFNGGTTYRGDNAAMFCGKVATLPVNEEPIGRNGLVIRASSPLNIHATQMDDLASIRAVGLRREEGFGLIFVSAKTAAHPDSDYTRISTIRSVNQHLDDIREIAAPYIGRPFSTQQLISLQSEIDAYLAEARNRGWNQGARASLTYTRADKIMGKLTVRLKLVPPFSIETITVETSLAADESEL